jgi:hypothetical protein
MPIKLSQVFHKRVLARSDVPTHIQSLSHRSIPSQPSFLIWEYGSRKIPAMVLVLTTEQKVQEVMG